MDDSELRTYFKEALFHHALTNGSLPSSSNDEWSITYDLSSGYTISGWTHDSSQPSDTTLKTYTVSQVLASHKIFRNTKLVTNNETIINTNYGITGPFSSPQTVNLRHTNVENCIMISVDTVDVTGNKFDTIQTTSPLDVLIRPSSSIFINGLVRFDGKIGVSKVEIRSDGIIVWNKPLIRVGISDGKYGFEKHTLQYCI